MRNGDEANVDCGGACGATCELGASCDDATDCLFGVCGAGICSAPTEGPEPTGPVSATIGPAGGALQVVTDERVQITLTFPAGAVANPMDVTLAPRTPVTRSWIEIELEPPAVVLDAPVTMSVELPPQVLSAGLGVLAFGNASYALQLETRVTEQQLSGNSLVLGVPALPERVAARPFLNPADLIFAVPLPLRVQVEAARQLLALLRATYRYSVALQLAGRIGAISNRKMDPDFDAAVQPLVDEAFPIACEGLTDAQAQLETSAPKCPSRLLRFARPVFDWAALLVKLEALREIPHCPAATPATPGGHAPYEVAIVRAGEQMVIGMLEDHARFVRCECDETPMEEWTLDQQLNCPRVATRTATPVHGLRAADDLFTDPGEWDIAIGSLERAQLEVVMTNLIGHPTGGAALQEHVIDPTFAMLRDMTYASCQRDGHPENVGKLLRVVSGRDELIEDAQYCASQLQAVPLASDAMTSTGSTVNLGAAAMPGSQTRMARIGVERSGWVRLGGTVAALRCPGATESEADELVVYVRTTNSRVEVARRVAGAQGLLSTPVELEIDALRTTAGQIAMDPTKVRLELARQSTTCDGLYGASEVTLFELDLEDSALLHLRFDDMTGTVAADSSGNDRDATLVGGPTFGAGQCGGALAFSSGHYATLAADSIFDFAGGYTISAWVNYQPTNNGHYIASTLQAAGSGGWGFLLAEPSSGTMPAVVKFAMFTDPNGDCNVAGGTVTSGTWHHVAVTGASGAPFTIYIDGAPGGGSSVSCTIAAGDPLVIGGIPGSPHLSFNGALDDLRIYDRALTASEVAALASPTCGP